MKTPTAWVDGHEVTLVPAPIADGLEMPRHSGLRATPLDWVVQRRSTDDEQAG